MQHNDAKSLFEKYQSGLCTPEEKEIVENWLTFGEASSFDLSDDELKHDLTELQTRVADITIVKKIVLWPRIVAAAMLLIFSGVGLYIYKQKRDVDLPVIAAHQDIAPGSDKAILTLANGSRISLTDAAGGELVKHSGIVILKNKEGQLVYQVTGKSKGKALAYNTIETPKGGQHQVVLADGTRVWLNAASSIKFPENFTNANQRKVELKGEAYFEVKKDQNRPFVVLTNRQYIEVLGTHFNVNSYADESRSATTLLEGSVKVCPVGQEKANVGVVFFDLATVIKPGQQASTSNGDLKILSPEIDQVMDWKNGDFMFKQESLAGIMRKVSRWYDVTVQYDKGIDVNQTYSGLVSRSKNISEVLKIMQSAGQLKFEVDGRKVIVKN
ncbi:FecR family protein [Pedobacter nyackensis]|uniref:FecR family protein n=1 Tax=Pedobacter nyackensis TaxID=475255 RepID=A0A1W2EI24_9SPHI|nr:FecR family protein [Pedobacter nyackensis]SMD09353.1 FecR family protein [Pedobacter nyackensis]